MATLIDDGTLDTVIRCDECGSETRFAFDAYMLADEVSDEDAATLYDAFVDECIADVDADCMHCSDAADEDEDGPCPECERSNGPHYDGPCSH